MRCREIWVEGARRYRNPDEDIPEDFEEKRNAYYDDLKLPVNSDYFIKSLQARMKTALHTLDTGLSKNKEVSIRQKSN